MTEPAKRKKRPAPALGAKIASAGVGASAMFGLMAVLGVTSQQGSALNAAEPAAAQPVVVVVHRSSGTSASNAAGDSQVSSTAGEVIELTANPVVRTVDAANATAVTNGSR